MLSITELTVNSIWAASKDNGVDLDGQYLMTRPEGIDEWSEEERRKWLKENGYDLSIDIKEEGVWLHAVETNLVVIGNEKWEEEKFEWIENVLQDGSMSSPLVFWELPAYVKPITFAFRTNDGVSGMFRIVEYSSEEKKANIQIKLKDGAAYQ